MARCASNLDPMRPSDDYIEDTAFGSDPLVFTKDCASWNPAEINSRS
jgi:hypothetical protein